MSELPRLSGTEALILDLLLRHGPSYGLQLVHDADGRLRRGSVYVLLERLERKGFVHSRSAAGPPGSRGPRRREYSVTGLGERVMRARDAARAAFAMEPAT